MQIFERNKQKYEKNAPFIAKISYLHQCISLTSHKNAQKEIKYKLSDIRIKIFDNNLYNKIILRIKTCTVNSTPDSNMIMNPYYVKMKIFLFEHVSSCKVSNYI